MEGRGMSKRDHQQPNQRAPQKATAIPAKTPEPVEPKQRTIEEYRHCPICWSGNGGYGTAYSTHGRTRYYKCDQSTTDKGPCGHTWSVYVKLEVVKVEYRIVTLDGER
jgi:hypothetical protein